MTSAPIIAKVTPNNTVAMMVNSEPDKVRAYDQAVHAADVHRSSIAPLQLPTTYPEGSKTLTSSYATTIVPTTIGHLSAYAVLAGKASNSPSGASTDATPNVQRVDGILSVLPNRVDAALHDGTYALLASDRSTSVRLRVDARASGLRHSWLAIALGQRRARVDREHAGLGPGCTLAGGAPTGYGSEHRVRSREADSLEETHIIQPHATGVAAIGASFRAKS